MTGVSVRISLCYIRLHFYCHNKMSQNVGLVMIISGISIFIALALKLLFQPFISEDHYIHHYFPSTELVLGIPIICGSVFFTGFGLYILKVLLKDKLSFLRNGMSDMTSS